MTILGIPGKKRRVLKKTAVPSVNLPSPTKGLRYHRELKKRLGQIERERTRMEANRQSLLQQKDISAPELVTPPRGASMKDLNLQETFQLEENISNATIVGDQDMQTSNLSVDMLQSLSSPLSSSTPYMEEKGGPTGIQDSSSTIDGESASCSSEDRLLGAKPLATELSTRSIGTQTEISGDISPFEPQVREEVRDGAVRARQVKSGDTKNVEVRDRGSQIKSGDILNSFTESLDTDKKVRAFTGISNMKFLLTIVAALNLLVPETSRGFLRTKEKVVLTYMKMKLNLSFITLGYIFNVSATRAKNVFHNTLDQLEVATSFSLRWPSKEEVMNNIPTSFRKFGYSNVRVVLDATEVKTTKTKCILCRCKAYSRYKGSHTLKFLVGVTPGGLISFVSKAFGGRASDKCIFLDSGLINHLEPHVDSVMVDKRVLIRDICAQHNIDLIHPEFLRKPYKQFSVAQSQKNFKVANCRVHVERAIGRIKVFKILKDGLPWNFTNYATLIFRVIAATVNLSNPIFAPDKFISPSQLDELDEDCEMFEFVADEGHEIRSYEEYLADDDDCFYDDIEVDESYQ